MEMVNLGVEGLPYSDDGVLLEDLPVDLDGDGIPDESDATVDEDGNPILDEEEEQSVSMTFEDLLEKYDGKNMYFPQDFGGATTGEFVAEGESLFFKYVDNDGNEQMEEVFQ